MSPTPADIIDFSRSLRSRKASWRVSLEQGGARTGEWWIDVRGAKPMTVEWRPDEGFGLSGPEISYGGATLRRVRSADEAARLVVEMAS